MSRLTVDQQLAILQRAIEHRLTPDLRFCTCGRVFREQREATVHQYEEVYLLGLSTGRAMAGVSDETGLPQIPNGRQYRREPPSFARQPELGTGWLVLGMDTDVHPGEKVDVQVKNQPPTTVEITRLVAERTVKHRKGNRVTRYVMAEFAAVTDDDPTEEDR
jgi:hypothetical protein